MTQNADQTLSETTVTVTVNGTSVTVGEFDELSDTDTEDTVKATVAHVLDNAGFASTKYRLYEDVPVSERNRSHRITGTHDFEDGSRYVAVPDAAFYIDGNDRQAGTDTDTGSDTDAYSSTDER